MPRSIPRLASLTTLAAFAASVAVAAPGEAGPPAAAVRVADCSRGADSQDRSVEFRAVARAVEGSDTMWIRFGLRERMGDHRYARLRVPGLGVWRRSRPGVTRFVHRQEVLALAEGADYRAVVHFRWYDADGELVKTAVRRSRPCRQGGDLPNLVVRRIRALPAPGSPGVMRYGVRVANRGGARARDAEVAFSVDAASVDRVAVGPLGPGRSREVFVNGPECRSRVLAEADPSDVVAESSESDNALGESCPLPR